MGWELVVERSPNWIENVSHVPFIDTINFLLLIMIVYCGYTDLFYQKIYNYVTLPAVVSGIVLNFLGSGIAGLKMSLIGAVVGFGLFFIVFMFGGMGGGDVKYMAAIGALCGYPFVIYASILSALAGGAISIIVMLYKGSLWKSLKNIARVIITTILPMYERERLKKEDSYAIPFGYAISIGTYWAWVLFLTGIIREIR